MKNLCVQGGRKLYGSVRVQGSKNICLPVMAASILNEGISVIENCPCIDDVFIMQEILSGLGCVINREQNTLIIDTANAVSKPVTADMAGKLRASSVLMGPLLARFGSVKTAKPGGCQIGKRPIDIHLDVFKRLGASWELDDEYVSVSALKLHEADIYLRFPSVGATQNAIMASVKVPGITIIRNAAKEPEIVGLCDYLTGCGADIKGAGGDTIAVRGVDKLNDTVYTIPADRMVMGTYIASACATRGNIKLTGCNICDAEGFLDVYTGMGLEYKECKDGISIFQKERPKAVDYIKTSVYPGFPTDMQPQMAVVLALAHGTSMVTESIFENRFKYVDELNRMGCHIKVEGNTAYIEGVDKITGAQMSAPDLRAGAALVIAALSADGISEIEDIEYIQRGYEDFEGKLRGLGAMIERVDSEREALKARLKIG